MKNFKRSTLALSILIALLAVTGCTDNARGKLRSFGDNQTVCLMNDSGDFIHKWVSTGKVDSHNGGLHVFVDINTGYYAKVSGLVITSTFDYCPNIDS